MREHICEHRRVADDGRVTCSKIVLGDDEVSVSLCYGCPACVCNCAHLCFSLQKISPSPVTVRWADGHVVMWNDQPPTLSFLRSACVLKTISISSSEDCLQCELRDVWLPEERMQRGPQEVVSPLPDNVIPFVTGAKDARIARCEPPRPRWNR